MSNLQWVKAIQAVNDDVIIQVGDQIKIWGHVHTVTGFYFTFNEGLMKWETIIMTKGRGGDPLERSLDVIEIDVNKPWKSPWETESPSSIEGEEKWNREQVKEIVNSFPIVVLDQGWFKKHFNVWFDEKYPPRRSPSPLLPEQLL